MVAVVPSSRAQRGSRIQPGRRHRSLSGRALHAAGENPPATAIYHVSAPTGTAVSDLQYLDKNSDLLQNFDALDDIDGDDDADSGN